MKQDTKYIGLSFIGATDYKETTYKYLGKEKSTTLFPLAFEEFFYLKTLYIVATVKARQKHLTDSNFKTELKVISIPEGRTETELWKIFDLIYKAIPENENLVIDVTHGFRSLPIITLSVLNYLRTIKNIRIHKIIYGAYDARDENNISPVFDLTPFINIIDWSYATYDFIKHGNSALLRENLASIQDKAYRENETYKVTSLKKLGSNLENLTNALSLAQVQQSTEYAYKTIESLTKVPQDIENLSSVKPLEPLLKQIETRFGILAKANKKVFQEEGFAAQLSMIDYLIETGQFMQAITIMRELIVSKIAQLNNTEPLDKIGREQIENILNEKGSQDFITIDKEILMNFQKLWNKVKDLRNKVSHAGMRKNKTNVNTIIVNIKNFFQELKKLMTKYGQNTI